MPENKKVSVSIDPWSVITTLGIFGILYLLWSLNSLLVILFLSFIISSTLRPFIQKIQARFKIPKPAIITTVFVLVFLVVSALGYMVWDNLSKEVRNLNVNEVVTDFMEWVDEVAPGDQSIFADTIEDSVNSNGTKLPAAIQNGDGGLFGIDNLLKGTNAVFSFLGKTVGGFVLGFTILIISFYMLSRDEDMFDGLTKFLPSDKQEIAKRLLTRIEKKLGSWLGAQLFLMFLIGMLTYLGLAIPSIIVPDEFFAIGRFAVTLAVIAGLLELVPGIGPTITLAIGIILSIATGGDNYIPQTIFVFIYFSIIQNLENTFIVPKLMKQAVGLDPIVTILSVMGAYTLMGPIGAIIIVPIMAAIVIVIEFFAEEKTLKQG